mmetsp:Transcript_21346/g.34527  ORF Transcript_21346/g.34527 Transcript_21346/m.34527 type:complete len:180 (-) Transcript_21346:128-667(-)
MGACQGCDRLRNGGVPPAPPLGEDAEEKLDESKGAEPKVAALGPAKETPTAPKYLTAHRGSLPTTVERNKIIKDSELVHKNTVKFGATNKEGAISTQHKGSMHSMGSITDMLKDLDPDVNSPRNSGNQKIFPTNRDTSFSAVNVSHLLQEASNQGSLPVTVESKEMLNNLLNDIEEEVV